MSDPIPAGWYQTADGSQWRWHDGTNWTDHVQPIEQVGVQPVEEVAPVIPVTPGVAAGWYQTADGLQWRWHDGTNWTDHVQPVEGAGAAVVGAAAGLSFEEALQQAQASSPASTGFSFDEAVSAAGGSVAYDPQPEGPAAWSPEPAASPAQDSYEQTYEPAFDDRPQPRGARSAYGHDEFEPVVVARPVIAERSAQRRGRGLKRLVPFVVALLVLLVGGAAFGAYKLGVFGAPGDQPSLAAPQDTIAFVAIDLNPSANAKLSAYQFAKRFAETSDVSKDSVDSDLVSKAAKDTFDGVLSYEKDLKPWLGNRFAFAVVPASTDNAPYTTIVILNQTDEKAAGAALTKLKAKDPESANISWAFKGDYVLVGDDKAAVEKAAAAEISLEDNRTYARERAALGEDVLTHAWVDGVALRNAIGEELPEELRGRLGDSLIAGISVTGNRLELVGHRYRVNPTDPAPTGELAGVLSENSDIAVKVTGLGDLLMDGAPLLSDTVAPLTDTSEGQKPVLTLPKDYQAIFGSDFMFGASLDEESPYFGVAASTKYPLRGAEIMTKVVVPQMKEAGLDTKVTPSKTGYVAEFGTSSGQGSLLDTPEFQSVIPDAEKANQFVFVDVPALMATLRGSEKPGSGDPAWMKAADELSAAGWVVADDGKDAMFRLRLVLTN